MIALNPTTIADEMMALGALHRLRKTPGYEAAVPLLTRDHMPMMRRLMREAFSRLVLDLADEVTDCSMPESDTDPEGMDTFATDSPMAMSLTLRREIDPHAVPLQLPAVKRQLEHLTALGALICAVAPSAMCTALTLQRNAALDSLLATLRADHLTVCRRAPAW